MNNIYLYLMLLSLLVGGFSGFVGYDNLERASRLVELENEPKLKELKSKELDKMAKVSEWEALAAKRKGLQVQLKELALAINEQKALKQDFERLDRTLMNSIDRQKVKFAVSRETVAMMQDQLSEDTTAIERSLENMNRNFEHDRQRLEEKQNVLREEEVLDSKKKAKSMSILETEIDTIDFTLRRVNNLSPRELTEPWVTGEVMEYNSILNRVVINLGFADGVKQNFKFAIFSAGQGEKARKYKGFVVIKKVERLVSVGAMEMVNGESPVPGDHVGSLVYRKDQMSYYLAGDFRSKYSKEKLKAFLEYCGNRVLEELSSEVDFFVMGSLADNEVPMATALGVSIIPEDSIAAYVGE
jgi:NAD-dependent DNA ligase